MLFLTNNGGGGGGESTNYLFGKRGLKSYERKNENETPKKNANMAIDIHTFNINAVCLLNMKKNNIIDGFFSKIIYTNHNVTFNGVYIWFQMLPNYGIAHKEHNYSIYYLDMSEEINANLYNQLASIEYSIIQYYKNTYKIHKPCFYQLKTQFQNGNIKIYKNTSSSSTLNTCLLNKKFLLKISGVWENKQNIGITYKITELTQQMSEPI